MKSLVLAMAFMIAPAFAGETEILKTQSCDTVPVRIVEQEPDLLVIGQPVNIFFAQAQARKLLKELKCAAPCESVGRVRSKVDCRCYKPGRLP